MISILIPTYNYDVTTLVYELHQQATRLTTAFEIIVFDDGSTNSLITEKNSSISTLSDCQYIRLANNQGRTYARNYLANRAVYNQLLFLDADVMPKEKTFVKDFIEVIGDNDIVFGGIDYSKISPNKSKKLRWKYGRAREAKPIDLRQKMPYLSIISQAFLINKDIFLKTNNFLENRYGLDVLFTYNLNKLNVRVSHIDNPVIHYGLENSNTFINKTIQAIETLVYFEDNRMIPNNFRPIQKAYLKLKKWRLLYLFRIVVHFFSSNIERNLHSSTPSLLLFDFYKLYHFIQLKK